MTKQQAYAKLENRQDIKFDNGATITYDDHEPVIKSAGESTGYITDDLSAKAFIRAQLGVA